MNNLVLISAVSRGWVWNIIRSFFAWLDSVAYSVFSWMMQLIFDIAAITSDPAFNSFYDQIHSRIYAVLAIFMLFKITISMLTYLVNPDTINDKERGMGKMATRVIVSLIMLIAFPNAFQFLNRIQPHIMEALPRVILGTSSVSTTDNGASSFNGISGMDNIGQEMAFNTYNGVWFNSNCVDYNVISSNGTNECFLYGNTFNAILEHINDPIESDDSTYKYDYFPICGFVTAIIMSIILIGFCIDVAIRVFKLIILQIIAPIPIISYIDPKSSKDGAFSKWLKMVGSVYLDLFIKLGVIYFVLLVINQLITNDVITNIYINIVGGQIAQNGVGIGIQRSGLILCALIIGLLFFAKDAPKFITDALGIKLGENNKLFGGLGKIMAAGAIGAGAIGAGIASARGSYMADEENRTGHGGLNILKNVGAGLLGGATGLGAGISAGINAKDHNARAVMDAYAKRNSRALAAGAAGSTLFGRVGSTLTGLIGGETAASAGKRNIAALEAQKSALETIKSRVSGEMVKQDWTQAFLLDKNGNALMKDVSGADVTGSINYKDFMARKNAAAAAGEREFEIMTSNGIQKITMTDAERYQGLILKGNEDYYLTHGASQDKILAADISEAEALGLHVTNRDSVNGTIDNLSVEIATAKRENAKKEQNDRFSGSGGK